MLLAKDLRPCRNGTENVTLGTRCHSDVVGDTPWIGPAPTMTESELP